MNRSVGISFVVLLSLIYCADLVLATKVCLLRKSETVKCSARGVHLDEAETVRLDCNKGSKYCQRQKLIISDYIHIPDPPQGFL